MIYETIDKLLSYGVITGHIEESDKIYELKNIEETVKKRKSEIKENIDILDGIIAEGAISNVNLRLLVNEIIILDMGGELAIVISMNAPFTDYGEVFDENGNVILRHNGNYKPISA